MAENRDEIQEIFKRRILLVQEMSALNAEQLHNSQELSGNEFDLQRCTEAMNEQGNTGQLLDEFNGATSREKHIRAMIADCDDKLEALERQVADLDRKLEGL